jgi:hypothetical protein
MGFYNHEFTIEVNLVSSGFVKQIVTMNCIAHCISHNLCC